MKAIGKLFAVRSSKDGKSVQLACVDDDRKVSTLVLECPQGDAQEYARSLLAFHNELVYSDGESVEFGKS